MKDPYSLDMPTASDLNASAHPGGGTEISPLTHYGRMDDLFGKHLKFIDVALKSKIAGILVELTDSLDTPANRDVVAELDSVLCKFANAPVKSDMLQLTKIMWQNLPLSADSRLHSGVKYQLAQSMRLLQTHIDRSEWDKAKSVVEAFRQIDGGPSHLSADGVSALDNLSSMLDAQINSVAEEKGGVLGQSALRNRYGEWIKVWRIYDKRLDREDQKEQERIYALIQAIPGSKALRDFEDFWDEYLESGTPLGQSEVSELSEYLARVEPVLKIAIPLIKKEIWGER